MADGHKLLPASESEAVPTYADFASLPVGSNGDLAVTLDTGSLYEYNGSAWQLIGAPGTVAGASDTNTVDMTLSGNVLSAVVKYQDSTSIDLSEDSSGLKAALLLSSSGANSGFFNASAALRADGLQVEVPQSGVIASPLTGYSAASGTVAATDTVLGAFQKVGFFLTDIAGSPKTVSDTNTVDMTLLANNLSAVVKYQDSTSIDLSDDVGGLKADLLLSASGANAGYFNASSNLRADGLQVEVPQAGIRTTPLTGYAVASGTVAATDTVLGAFQKVGYFIANNNAGTVVTDATNFDKNLSASDTTMQAALTTFDEFNALPNDATNASASPDIHNKTAFASSASGTSAVFTFGSRGAIEFLVDVNTDGGMVIACDYKATTINALSDPSGLFLATDAGTGIVVTKSANSAAVTIKNRTGATKTIGVMAVRSSLTATAWS